MSELQKGAYAVVWGANVGVAYIANGVTVAASGNKAQGFTMTTNADSATIKDQVGQSQTMVFSDQSKNISIEVVPGDGTNIANANDNGVVPTPGTLVTLSLLGTTHDQVTANHSGKYIAMDGCQLTASNTGEARITMNLYQNTGVDMSATLS